MAVACGANHALVMDEEGRLYTWGFGGYGRLGLGDVKNQFTAQAIPLFCAVPPPPNPNIPVFAQRVQPKIRAAKIACGTASSFAIIGQPFHSLYFWGITKKAGEAQTKPIIFDELQGQQSLHVSSGNTSTIVACGGSERLLVTWGPSPTYGELGYGEGAAKSSTKAKEVDSLSGADVIAVAAGLAHNLVLVNVVDHAPSKALVEKSPTLVQDEPPKSAGAAAKKLKPTAPDAAADDVAAAAEAGGDDEEEEEEKPKKKKKGKKA